MLWLAFLFIALAFVVDWIALKSKGTLISFILVILAFGFSIIALPFILMNNPVLIANLTVITPNGNVILPAFNETASPTTSNLGFMTILGELNAIVQFCFALFIFLLMLTDRKNRRYK